MTELFSRFTERARDVVKIAEEEAQKLDHTYTGTEHILLGLLREEAGTAAKVLRALNIAEQDVRYAIIKMVGRGSRKGASVPYTPRAKKVLELSLREALSRGNSYIATEHILLGLVRENSGIASRILDDLGADAEKIRTEVLEALGLNVPHSSKPKVEGSPEEAIEDEFEAVLDVAMMVFGKFSRALKAAVDAWD